MKASTRHTAYILLISVVALYSYLSAAQLRDGFSVAYQSPPAPPLSLASIESKQYTLSALRGQVVVINFWATWCPPCLEEMPSMQRMWDRLHPRGLEILAVNVGEDENTITRFLERFEPRLRFPILLDLKGEILEAWQVQGLPKTYVVNKKGLIIYIAEGGRDMDSEHIRGLLTKLIEQ